MKVEPVWRLAPETVLRRMTLRDAPALAELVARSRDRLRPWMPWVDEGGGLADAVRFLREARAESEEGPVAWECALEVSGQLEGMIGLSRVDWTHRSASLGFWVTAAVEGRGLVTGSAHRLVRLGFHRLGLERLELKAAADNVRSRNTAVRVGFREEGRLRRAALLHGERRDVIVYGLLPEDLGA